MYPNLTNFQRLSLSFTFHLILPDLTIFPSHGYNSTKLYVVLLLYFLSVMLILLPQQEKFPEGWIHDTCTEEGAMCSQKELTTVWIDYVK